MAPNKLLRHVVPSNSSKPLPTASPSSPARAAEISPLPLSRVLSCPGEFSTTAVGKYTVGRGEDGYRKLLGDLTAELALELKGTEDRGRVIASRQEPGKGTGINEAIPRENLTLLYPDSMSHPGLHCLRPDLIIR